MHPILDHLCKDHSHMGSLLATMERRLQTLSDEGQVDLDGVRAVIYNMIETPDCTHHPIEDIVFQKLIDRDPAARHVVNKLIEEHARLRQLGALFLKQLELVVLDGPVLRSQLIETGNEYLLLLRDHMSEEESVVFPWADSCLQATDWKFVQKFAETRTPIDANTESTV